MKRKTGKRYCTHGIVWENGCNPPVRREGTRSRNAKRKRRKEGAGEKLEREEKLEAEKKQKSFYQRVRKNPFGPHRG